MVEFDMPEFNMSEFNMAKCNHNRVQSWPNSYLAETYLFSSGVSRLGSSAGC